MLTYTRLLEDFTADDPLNLHSGLGGKEGIAKSLLACPSCDKPLLYCPRCGQQGPTLRLLEPDRTLVIHCRSCLNGESICFDKCWGCSWQFKDATNGARGMMGAAEGRRKGRKEGFMWKLGRTFHRWTRRYYVLVGNMLYYYEDQFDQKPLGVMFLEGCFVKRLATLASKADDDSKLRSIRRGVRDPNPSTMAEPYDVDVIADRPSTRKGAKSTDRWGLVLTQKSGHKKMTRELYLETMEDRDTWVIQMCTGTGQRKVDQVFQFGEKIGQGKFSTVYRAAHSITRHQVAIKVIKKNETTAIDRDLLRTELRVISILNHENIIKIIDTFDEQNTVCIVMELVEGGELFDHLAEVVNERGGPEGGGLAEVEVQHLMKELLTTVAYLSTCGIAHRDLKPENILLTSPDSSGTYHIKLADFGLSSICGPSGVMTQPCGTLPYVAPEVLGLKTYGKQCDVWACGVIMYLLLRGRLPFHTGKGLPAKETYQLKMDDFVWHSVSNSAKDLLTKLLTIDPKERIRPHEALQHVWIKNPAAAISAPRASQPPTHLALVPDTAWNGLGEEEPNDGLINPGRPTKVEPPPEPPSQPTKKKGLTPTTSLRGQNTSRSQSLRKSRDLASHRTNRGPMAPGT